MARLKSEHKLAIVDRLACLYTPAEVVAFVKEEFDIVLSRPAVQHYDPSSAMGADLAPELRERFFERRKRFLAEVDGIPVANQAYRLRKLQDLIDRQGTKNPGLVAELIEQAAKERGGMFTNRRELTGKDGGPIETKGTLALSQLSDEELDAFDRLLEKAAPGGGG